MPDYKEHLLKILGQMNKSKNVSRETFLLLEEFTILLLKWNQKINLVSKNITTEELWWRHIINSVELLHYIPDESKKIVDLGSGAGFPGLILAMIGNYDVTLIESDQRKCAFLQEVVSKFHLRIRIINERIENIQPFPVDIITSRALASLIKLLEYSHPFLGKNNFMLFLKGQNVSEEIKEAAKYWDFEYIFYPDLVDQKGGVLKVSNARRIQCSNI